MRSVQELLNNIQLNYNLVKNTENTDCIQSLFGFIFRTISWTSAAKFCQETEGFLPILDTIYDINTFRTDNQLHLEFYMLMRQVNEFRLFNP